MNALERRPWLVTLAVALILAVHYALAVGSKFTESTTSDEIVHLTGGFTFDHFNDYRLHPENGVLPQRVAALPAVLAGAKYPSLDQVYWTTSDAWVMGHQFFYETGEDHFPRLMAGRALIALFSVGTGLLVFAWSRVLFGTAGALVSLVFFAFSPTFLAHGALATSDACMTFFMLASIGAWWRHLHDAHAKWWWLSAVVFGLACVAKYSAPLLLPMFVVIAAVRAWRPEPMMLLGRPWTTRLERFGAAALSALGHGLVAAVVIWAFFGFRYSAFNPALPAAEHFIRPWEWLDANLGVQGKVIRAIASAHLLPEGYLYGLAYVLETAQVRSAFLNGEFSITGWPTFFLWAFVLKTTIPLMIASALGAWLAIKRGAYRLAPLLALLGIYWAYSLTSHLNIGQRHIMPTYPVLYILCGALGAWFITKRAWLAVIALAGWHVGECVRVAPHFLAYFNELGGGPIDGHEHLVDSSLDWGQDLPGLKKWLEANAHSAPAYLSYFGTGEPDYYHIQARRLPFMNGFKLPSPPLEKLEPGVYCVSATMLAHVYSPIRGPWTIELEKEFLAARSLEPQLIAYTHNPAQRAELEAAAPAQKWQAAATRYDLLRFARLCYYLRVRPIDAHVGYSIFIYRLTAEEIRAATEGSIADWQALIERTIAAKDQ